MEKKFYVYEYESPTECYPPRIHFYVQYDEQPPINYDFFEIAPKLREFDVPENEILDRYKNKNILVRGIRDVNNY